MQPETSRMALRDHSKTRQRLALLFSVPVVFSLLFFLVDQYGEHTDLHLIQIQNLTGGVNKLLSLSRDIQAGERGFLLTGDEHYLLPLKQARAFLASDIDACKVYAADKPQFQSAVDDVAALVQQRAAQSDQILETQRKKGFAAALDLIKTGEAENTVNQLSSRVKAVQSKLSVEQEDYIQQQRNWNAGVFFSFLVGIAVMVAVLTWLYRTVVSYLHARDEAQAQLQLLNTELEARIDERTRELQISNEELQQFAYVASHDLQEPLRTITSFTQLIANRYKGKLDEDADEFIGYIVTSSRRMTDLINGLLALVRLRTSVHPTTPVSFEKLLDDAEISLQATIRENRVTVERGPLPALAVDKVQFAQVFQNLINNAIKYRSAEDPMIKVQAHKEGDHWVFSIKDNGRGFDQQFAERIFGLFQRLHTREVEGTGMGLTIARKIVERHGGKIWAESAVGAGSIFYFSLPAALEVLRAAPQERAPQAARA